MTSGTRRILSHHLQVKLVVLKKEDDTETHLVTFERIMEVLLHSSEVIPRISKYQQHSGLLKHY